MMTSVIRTLIVDDEPLAREGLRVRLGREPDIDIVGEAEDGPSAVAAILAERPALVFLDVQMPGFDGFEVVSRAALEFLPNLVFVTAYDNYALQAFGVHAIDYLLKPIAHRRFQEALRRARLEIQRGVDAGAAERLRALLDAHDARPGHSPASPSPAVEPGLAYATRFSVRDGERYILLKTAEIDTIEAAANYVVLHAGAKSYQLRMTVNEIERRLDPKQFTRVHRSALVNLDSVASIEPDFHGDYQVVLATGRRLRLSRGYRSRLI